jgi:hypothetical protein
VRIRSQVGPAFRFFYWSRRSPVRRVRSPRPSIIVFFSISSCYFLFFYFPFFIFFLFPSLFLRPALSFSPPDSIAQHAPRSTGAAAVAAEIGEAHALLGSWAAPRRSAAPTRGRELASALGACAAAAVRHQGRTRPARRRAPPGLRNLPDRAAAADLVRVRGCSSPGRRGRADCRSSAQSRAESPAGRARAATGGRAGRRQASRVLPAPARTGAAVLGKLPCHARRRGRPEPPLFLGDGRASCCLPKAVANPAAAPPPLSTSVGDGLEDAAKDLVPLRITTLSRRSRSDET